jgi:enoyl-CoA hydratase/carnithine racemase
MPSILKSHVDPIGRRVVLTLDRPDRGNALSEDAVEQLSAELAIAESAREADTIVFRSEGANFCTGFDWSGTESASDGDLLLRFARIEMLLAAIWSCSKRTVALIQGRAWGAGADLAIACDVRIAEPKATFRFPGAAFGVVLGTRRLAERVGTDVARNLILTGASLCADEAKANGVVTELGSVQADDLSRVIPPLGGVDEVTRRAVHAASRPVGLDTDLANLVRSVARPGIAERLAKFRAAPRPKADCSLGVCEPVR